MQISVVIPVLNEAVALPLLLHDLRGLRAAGAEIIVVDGGSSDASCAAAQGLADRILTSPPGRARQLNAGAAAAAGDMLVFLHADTRVPDNAASAMAALALRDRDWGFFRVRLCGRSRLLPLVTRMMGWRSRIVGIATGDQGLFVRRALFDLVAGYPDQPLMEDVEICRRLRQVVAGHALDATLLSSGRRWDRDGAVRTIVHMWWIRLRYFLGADPLALHRSYYRE